MRRWQRNPDFQQCQWQSVVSQWQSHRGRNQSAIRRHSFWQLHHHSHDWRLQQFTFCGDNRHSKSSSCDTNDHTQRAYNFLRRWQRDVDVKQRYRKSVVSEWQSDCRCHQSTVHRERFGQLHRYSDRQWLHQHAFHGNDGYSESTSGKSDGHQVV